MAKNLESKIQEFACGKYSAFWALFDAASVSVWKFLLEKTQGNDHLAKILHVLTMYVLLNAWTKEWTLKSYTEADFLNLAEEKAYFIWEQYSIVLNDNLADDRDRLKLRLQAELDYKKAHDSRFFAYYVHHFKYYFLGASVVIGIGIFAFLFWLVTINKVPSFFSNPKVLIMTGNQAFGALSGMSNVVRSDQVQNPLMQSTFDAYLQIKKENFPSLPKVIQVAKAQSKSFGSLTPLMKMLNLPALKRDRFADKELKKLTLGSGARNITLDLEKKSLSISLVNWTRLKLKEEFATSDSAIKKKIRNQISAFGLSLDQYGTLSLQKGLSGDVISGFIPRIFNGKLVYDEQGKMQGIKLFYHLASEEIISVENYSFQSREVSKYSALSVDDLLKKAVEIWLYPQSMAQTMDKIGRWELVYQQRGAFLIPVIRRNSEGVQFFLSLLAEK